MDIQYIKGIYNIVGFLLFNRELPQFYRIKYTYFVSICISYII